MTKLVRLILCATALLCLGAASALAQTFQAGQQIEYRRTGSLNWERGVIVRPTADGRQYVIRQKPSQFFPEGAEATYWPNELRVPQAAQAPAPQPQPTPNQPRAAPPAGPPAGPVGVGPGGLKPGDTVEYKASSWPERWEVGTIISLVPGGNQWIIREKPSQFFPEGSQKAYALADVRRTGAPPPQPLPPNPQRPIVVQPGPQQPAAGPAPTPAAGPAAGPAAAACPAGGPMSEEDVLAYSRQVLGPNPWGPNRDRGVAQIRECINRRGATFVSGQAFDNRMHAQGTNSVHINYAIDNNYGPPPALADYIGTFDLTSANRGSTSVKRKNATTIKKTTIDSQARLGGLTINPDRTYAWDVKGDGRQIVRGTWREATPADMMEYEGGPGIVLLKAREGFDYHVRVNRTPGWEGDTWIEVGTGRGRQSVQYGLKL